MGRMMSAKMSIEIKTKWEVNGFRKKRVQAMNEYPAECYVALLVRISVYQHYTCRKKNRERVISRIYVSRVRWKEDLQPHCIHLLMDMAKKKSPPNKQFIQHTPFISCRTTAKKSSILFFSSRKAKIIFSWFRFNQIGDWSRDGL